MGIKCPKCQFENPDDAVYCGKCTTPLRPEDISAPTETLEAAKEELTTGSTFAGRYQIIEELGKGGMGKVYKANDTKINEKIALKLIKPEVAADKKTIERFSNELKFARKIRHNNVCQMFDLNEEQGTHYITMEYVRGEDLKRLIRKMGQLSVGQVIPIAKQVCDGLAEAHRLGVVHRDLKPQNVMVDEEGNARIMDFGIARSIIGKGITGAGVMIGTPEYMSPEQAEVKEVDQRSDIYSLGVILYEMVTGRVPFEGETPLGIAMKHKSEMPKDPRELNAQIPEDLSQVILRCMEKDKEKRYQSAGEVSSELSRIEKGIPSTEREIPKRKPITSKEITVTFGLRKLFIPTLIVVAFVIAAFIVIRLFLQKEEIPSGPGKPSIAVLPFGDLSPEKDQGYLCEGFAESLINALAKIKYLRVPARTSSFSFKGKAFDIKEIGKELDVKTVLEGSVQKAGNKIRITVKLINVADESLLWSEQYNRKLEDVFSIQDDISLEIVDKLKINLLGEEQESLIKRYTENVEAYEFYLQGRFFWWKRTEEGLNKALEYFAHAIDKDPNYALAHVGLADTYTMLNAYNMLSRQEVLPKIRAEVKKALTIDDKLAEAHTSMGNIKMFYDWDWEGAKKEFRLAIKLNPNYLWAHLQYVDCLMYTGQFDKAFEEIKRAYELDPLNVVVNFQIGYTNYYARRYKKAEEAFKKVTMMDPNFYYAYFFLGTVYLQQSRYNKARAEFQKVMNNIKERLSYAHFLNCIALAKMGKKEEAEKMLEELLEQSKQVNIFPVVIAGIYAALDQKDKAFEWLRKAFEEHDIELRSLKVEPEFDSLRSDPRFTDLLKKIGLE
jgi:serine/threonine protein kinase/tetratricopeptide (TPR) repeat protein